MRHRHSSGSLSQPENENVICMGSQYTTVWLMHVNLVKMGSPIDPGNLVSQGYANFQKGVWITIVF